jgi:hypothetical protein
VSKASGSMDKGKQTVTNFFVTTDQDVNPATEPAVGEARIRSARHSSAS